MQARLGTYVYKFGGDQAICQGEEPICANVYTLPTDERRTPHDGISSFRLGMS